MTYSIELDSQKPTTLTLKLYKNVRNLKTLKEKLLSGELKCSIMKPSLICDPFQVAVATNKALMTKKLTTKSIYSEILFNLSISKNITQSLIKFGLDDTEKPILVAVVGPNEEAFEEIDGDEVDVARLSEFSDFEGIKRVYNVSEEEIDGMPLLDAVVTRIATKDLVLH